MDEKRLNPDTLLERVAADERTRGRLKVYLGMAAGSGKTYAMLSDAIVEKKRGVDVVAGYIEPHGRVETERLAKELEELPLRRTSHKGIEITEFNLDGALVRNPKILLIDELAHSNAPGSRHVKRWQDVEECLNHGISVYTTVNVQHVESLSDVVQQITGIQVTEMVPDQVIRKADEIELIDITPEELTQRIKEGKVYLREKAETALNHFFKPGNLMALRELVLRLTAERVDEQLTTFRRQHEVREVWPARPRVLVCVSPNFLSDKVVRTAARLASSLRTELVALSVDRSTVHLSGEAPRNYDQTSLGLSERLGARVIRRSSDDIVSEILKVAREQNASIIVVGKPVRSRIREYLYGSVVDELIRQSGDLDVYVITDQARDALIPLLLRPGQVTRFGVLKAAALVVVTTGFCAIAEQFLDISNLAMGYLLSVAWAAAKWGRFESITAAVLGVLAFDFCFVPPRWTFAVSDVQYLVTFLVMLVIGILISALTARVRAQADLVASRERRTSALYELSKLLSATNSVEQIAQIVFERTRSIFLLEGVLLLPKGDGELTCPASSQSGFERETNEVAVAQWVSERNSPAGAGTMTLAGAKGFYLPLPGPHAKKAVLGILKDKIQWDAEQRSVFEAFASQVGSTLARVYAQIDSTNQEIEVARERVRNLLLSAVSHDFRTPLTAIAGAADTLLERYAPKVEEGRDLIESIKNETATLSRMVRNVLDLTRLESGELTLNLEWEALEEVIGAALQRTRALLGARKVTVNLAAELPLLRVDATLLNQVFVNLFENVAKHAPTSSIVAVEGQVVDGHVQITVTDNGPGVPRGLETRVFEKAFRGKGDTEGFGLGLTICATVLTAHGGSILARNIETGGTQFVLTLPIPEQQPEGSHVA